MFGWRLGGGCDTTLSPDGVEALPTCLERLVPPPAVCSPFQDAALTVWEHKSKKIFWQNIFLQVTPLSGSTCFRFTMQPQRHNAGLGQFPVSESLCHLTVVARNERVFSVFNRPVGWIPVSDCLMYHPAEFPLFQLCQLSLWLIWRHF